MKKEGPVALLSYAIACSLVGIFLAFTIPAKEQSVRLFIAGISAMCLLTYTIVGERIKNWLFPAFELSGEGAQSSGSRRLATILLLVASVPIGILVNKIS
jgi:hypothetical protein